VNEKMDSSEMFFKSVICLAVIALDFYLLKEKIVGGAGSYFG
jgi:hypothetical protein